MTKITDLARVFGVSERHLRRLIQKNESDLAGHYERRGNEGTFVDDYAVDVLKSKLQKQYDMQVQSSSERERQLESTVTELSMRYAAAMEKLVENAGAVALLEAAKENVAQLEARASEREREIMTLEAALEGAREDARFQAEAVLAADGRRAEAEERAAGLQAQLDRLATAGYRERRKILKDLKKQRKNKE